MWMLHREMRHSGVRSRGFRGARDDATGHHAHPDTLCARVAPLLPLTHMSPGAEAPDGDGLKVRRTHAGRYKAATPHESAVLLQAFPLAEQLQHAADAFLQDRRRFHDPSRTRAVIAARNDATLAQAKQARTPAPCRPTPACTCARRRPRPRIPRAAAPTAGWRARLPAVGSGAVEHGAVQDDHVQERHRPQARLLLVRRDVPLRARRARPAARPAHALLRAAHVPSDLERRGGRLSARRGLPVCAQLRRDPAAPHPSPPPAARLHRRRHRARRCAGSATPSARGRALPLPALAPPPLAMPPGLGRW